jgi:hypothetical protein
LSLQSSQPYFDHNRSATASLTTQVKQPTQRYHNPKPDNRLSHLTQSQRSVLPRNSTSKFTPHTSMADKNQFSNYPPKSMFNQKSTSHQPISTHQFSNCKVCGRKNHRTIDCFYKRTTGCFNCGQSDNVRDCTLPPNFQ